MISTVLSTYSRECMVQHPPARDASLTLTAMADSSASSGLPGAEYCHRPRARANAVRASWYPGVTAWHRVID